MKELVFEISDTMEDILTAELIEKGYTSFYIEKTGNRNYIKLYLNTNDIPSVLANEIFVSSAEVDPSTWNRAWGETYNGDELTSDIFVLPEGKTLPDKEYEIIIKIDPFDSFGDGHHPTTRLCGILLEEILKKPGIKRRVSTLSMLDIGTGSGILSIAAWALGVRDIELFDYDQVSVEKAVKNLKMNGIISPVPFVADIYQYTTDKKFDLITANLLSRLLEDNIKKLIELLKPEGCLIVSGVSTKWTDELIKVFSKNNLEILQHSILEEWNGFILRIKQNSF